MKCIDVKTIQVSVLTQGVGGGADGPGRSWPLTAETNFILDRALPQRKVDQGGKHLRPCGGVSMYNLVGYWKL